MKLEIEKSLIVSTAHISKEDGKLLDAIDVGHLIVDKYSFGWKNLSSYHICNICGRRNGHN